jgi:excisionase family DNA binding protein
VDEDVWLTASEVAKRLGVSRSTVWRMSLADLPYVTTRGGQRRYRLAAVLSKAGDPGLEARVSDLEQRVTRLEDAR